MIEAMYFVTVTGPKEDLERVTDQYLSQYSIQLENALTVLRNNAKLVPLTDKDPYREIYAQSENMRPAFGDLRTAKLHTLSALRALLPPGRIYRHPARGKPGSAGKNRRH